MISKDYALSKKEGWTEYTQKTWMLLPKLFNSDVLSLIFYITLSTNIFVMYELGGIEATIKQI